MDRRHGTGLAKGLPQSLKCIVIPTRIRAGEAQVYLPPHPDEVWGLDAAQLSSNKIASTVEHTVQRHLQLSERPFALRAGKSKEGKILMVAIAQDNICDARAARKTRSTLVPRSKRVAMWCTLSALAVASPATHWAVVAACTVREFTTHDASTRQHALAEWDARAALGLNIGVSRPMARRVDRLSGGSVTPRQLYEEGDFGLRHLRDLLETFEGPAQDRIREWSASQTLRVTAKCDQWGTCWGTEPVLPFHDDDLNPARWLRDMEVLWPCNGQQREHVALFAQQDGSPFSDSVFSNLIHSVLERVLGHQRASLYSPHSWRVWLASALRVLGASDALIQSFGRWMNPDSLKIYSRMTAAEYTMWMDKVMAIRSLDATRVTNIPVMDTIDILQEWRGHHALALFDTDSLTDACGSRAHKTSAASTRQTPLDAPQASSPIDERRTPAALTRKAARRCERRTPARQAYSHDVVGRLTSTTTGVGSLAHTFPTSLDSYCTYNERASTRREPTPRERA
ncbi:hypothetical protein AB1Y20_009255 [Prymnesium parvum]|uniref:Uncharacterized protein n=1 Tax=Prymnesium parvum TaxID=97485 RepID=A0AB34JZV0_PRYPA